MFPSDDILIARGKYSTLGKERRGQLERVQGICTTIITAAQATLRDCEQIPPVNTGPISTLETCVANLQEARETIVDLANNMQAVKPIAWAE